MPDPPLGTAEQAYARANLLHNRIQVGSTRIRNLHVCTCVCPCHCTHWLDARGVVLQELLVHGTTALEQRDRFNRRPTQCDGKAAVLSVLQDEPLDELTAGYLVKAMGATGMCKYGQAHL